jgi:hypothetical protein
VGAAIGGSDVVGIRKDVFVVVGVAPLHGDFDLDAIDSLSLKSMISPSGVLFWHMLDVFA